MSLCQNRSCRVDEGPGLPEPKSPTPLDRVDGVLEGRPAKKPKTAVKTTRIDVDIKDYDYVLRKTRDAYFVCGARDANAVVKFWRCFGVHCQRRLDLILGT